MLTDFLPFFLSLCVLSLKWISRSDKAHGGGGDVMDRGFSTLSRQAVNCVAREELR